MYIFLNFEMNLSLIEMVFNRNICYNIRVLVYVENFYF